MKNVLFATAAVVALAGSAQADLLAYWNFNNSIAGNPSGNLGVLTPAGGPTWAADLGSGSLSTNITVNTSETVNDGTFGTFAGNVLNALNADPSGGALAVQSGAGNVNNGNYFQFAVSSLGFQDVVLTYATRGTSSGFTSHDFSFSTDGINFTSLGSQPAVITSTWAVTTLDLSAVPAADNAAGLIVRITLNGATSTNGLGNNRFDNVQFNATQVPTPGALALLGLGGIVALRRRRA